MPIRLVKTTDPGFKPLLKRILERRGTRDGSIERRVSEIIDTVRRQGDRAVLRYTAMFDHVRLKLSTLEVKKSEIEAAFKTLPRDDLSALRLAAVRISIFHRHHRGRADIRPSVIRRLVFVQPTSPTDVQRRTVVSAYAAPFIMVQRCGFGSTLVGYDLYQRLVRPFQRCGKGYELGCGQLSARTIAVLVDRR